MSALRDLSSVRAADRIGTLESYAVLGSSPEEAFDDVAQLAAQLCAAPIALVSLISGDRLWFKSRVGFPLQETDLESSICVHVLSEPDLLVIPDLTLDLRTRGNPFVADNPGIRFYAGAPLRTPDGQTIGSLCVIDYQPRPSGLTDAQANGLRSLARQVMTQLELRRAVLSRDMLLVEQQSVDRERNALQRAQAAVADAGGDIDIIFDVLLAGAMQAVPAAEAGVIELIDKDELEYRAVRGTIAAHRGLRVSLEGSLAGACALRNEALLISDVLADPRTQRSHSQRLNVRSAVFAPVVQNGRVVGVLKLHSSQLDAFTPHDLQIACLFAGAVTAGLTEVRAATASNALASSEERQRLAVEATGIGIFDFYPESGVLTWDARVRGLFGVSLHDPVTYEDTFLKGLHPDDRDAADGAVRQALDPSGSGVFDIEYRVLPLDGGRERWLAASGRAIVECGKTVRFIGTVRDITAQKHAELALAATQERFRVALRATNDALWDWDLVRDHVLWNEALTTAYGHAPTENEQTGGWWLGHIHPDDRERISRSIHDVIDHGGETWTDKYRFLRADGRYATIVDRGYVIRDPAGKAIRMVGAMLDVTEFSAAQRRQAALVALNDRTRDLMDPEEIAFVACEVLGTALGVSRVGYGIIDKVAETVGIERDWTHPGIGSLAGTLHFRDYGSYIDDLKRGITVIVSDAELDPRTQASASALKAISAQSFVNMPLVEQGQFVALLFANHVDARAWSEGDIALIREMAERTRIAVERVRSEAERRRQSSELARLNAALEDEVEKRTRERDRVWSSTNDLMGTAGLDGYLKAVNPAWTRMLGWSEAELLARPFIEIVDPEDHAETGDVVRRLAAGETVTDFVDRVDEKDGGQRMIMWDATPDGALFHIVGRDITALRHTEAALRQSQKMEAVGQLTGGIAHDFNNLLTGITGSLDLMAARIEQGRYNDIDRYTAAARGAAKRAAALTHRLLAFSRQQTLEPKPVDMNRLVAGMEDLVRRTVGPSIHVEVVAAGGLWPTLVDPHQLENALLNLCINARDAMPDGGRLTVETSNRWLDARAAKDRDLAQGQYVSLCVSDSGTGMTPDVISRAFDPFFTTKPLGQGTGLGLSMIYGFARQSGGQVRIYSEIGAGTNVCIYLPRHVGEAVVAEPQDVFVEPPRAAAGQTVLVVDDEPTVRMLVTDVLEELGYAAIEAGDASSGLKVLQSDVRIDLLVTDVGLPGNMNGRQMADSARVGRPKLKVLFITGYAENAAVGNGLLDPGMHVMTKPFAMDALASRIRELIVEG